MDITPLQRSGILPELPDFSQSADAARGDHTFAHLLRGALGQVNHLQQAADGAAQDFAVGEATSIHDTMIALEKADLSMRLMIQVRNKAIEAYQEVMRMQV